MVNGSSAHESERFAGKRCAVAPSLAFVLALACASPPPPARSVGSLPPPKRAAIATDPGASPAPAEAPKRGASADSIVTLIAKPGLWPLDVESARRVLEALGPVTREQPSPNELSLVGGPYGALDHFDVDYSLDDDRYWVFGSAGFFLGDRDLVRLYRATLSRLTELLGKPASTDDDDEVLPTVTWNLGEAVLSLARSSKGDEPQVLIAIRESPE